MLMLEGKEGLMDTKDVVHWFLYYGVLLILCECAQWLCSR